TSPAMVPPDNPDLDSEPFDSWEDAKPPPPPEMPVKPPPELEVFVVKGDEGTPLLFEFLSSDVGFESVSVSASSSSVGKVLVVLDEDLVVRVGAAPEFPLLPPLSLSSSSSLSL